MCKKTNYKIPNPRIDKCMKTCISNLNLLGIRTVASCCGHGKYPMTIVFKSKFKHWEAGLYELFSGIRIPRTRNIYKRDKQGYYYIPEVCNGE